MLNLPLSWIRQNRKNFKIKLIPTYFEKGNWWSLGKVPLEYDFIEHIINYIGKNNNSVFLRGINFSTSKTLKNNGFEVIHLGQEAVLCFNNNHFQKKSLNEIIRRGLRNAYVEEIPYSPAIEKQLLEFEKKTVHGSEPFLKHLYVTGLPKDTRLFVIKNIFDDWLGAIVVSDNSKYKFQTEFLLRKKSAPVGTMEALVFKIFCKLKNEDKKYWSLGEVPFVLKSRIDNIFSKTNFYNKIGHLFGFAYNYEGLYFFKNKFNPDWEPIFIAGYPKITVRQLLTVAIKSNLISLIIFKLLHPFKYLIKKK